MKTDTITPDDADNVDTTSTALFRTFAEPRRQRAMQYLVSKPGAVPLGDLAEYIAVAEGEPTRDRYERVLVSLAHTHVPHMREADLVEYDETTELVELVLDPEAVRPYLRLSGISTSA